MNANEAPDGGLYENLRALPVRFFDVPYVIVPEHGLYVPAWTLRLAALVENHRAVFFQNGIGTYAALCLKSLLGIAVRASLTEREFIALFDEIDAVIGVSAVAFTRELCAIYREPGGFARLRNRSS